MIENQKNFAYSAIEEIVDVITISIPEHAISAALVQRYCPELFMEEKPDITTLDIGTYERLLTLLFSGRACCHLDKEEEYAWVREYFEKVKKEHVERMKGKLG